MRSLWLLLLTGCEKMDDPGPLFSAVAVEKPATSSVKAPEPDSDFDFPEPIVISSDDLQAGRLGDAADPVVTEPVVTEPVVTEPVAEVEPVVVETTEPITVSMAPEVASVPPAPAPPAPIASAMSWPVRLVKTLPETNPPRAILGLPDGRELVVSPGTMVPEHGLVVIAIGPNSAQIAQITPQGDFAAVSPLTLQTMY